MRDLALAVAIVTLAACSNDSPGTGPGTPPTYTLPTTRQWSGGLLLLRSSQADPGHPNRLVIAGSDSIVASAIDDTTFAFLLPQGPSGAVTISVSRTGGGQDSIGSVSRVGFSGTEEMLTPSLSFSGWRPGGHPAILGIALPSGDLASYDLATGIATNYPGLKSGGEFAWPVSILERGTSVTTAVHADTMAITQLFPSLVSRDTFVATGGPRQVIVLGDSLYLATFHHSAVIRTLDNSRQVLAFAIEAPNKIIESPDGRLAVVTGSTHASTAYGVPVLNAQTGESLFVAPLEHVSGAAFSPDGSVLYVVGGHYPAYDTLRAVNTASGATMMTAVLPDSALTHELAFDAASGTLYVAAEHQTNAEVLVYDGATFAHLGTLPTGLTCGPCQPCDGSTLLDAPGHRLYMVGYTPSGGDTPSTVLVFDLLLP